MLLPPFYSSPPSHVFFFIKKQERKRQENRKKERVAQKRRNPTMEQDKDEAASRTPFPMESIPESSSSVISSPSASLDSPFSSRSPLDSPSSKQSTSPLEVVSSPEAEREDTRLSMEEHLEKKMRFRRPRTPSVEHPSLMESERGKKSAWNPFFQDSTYHTPSWGPMAMGSVIKGVIMECLIKGYEGVFLFVTTMELILAFHVLTTNPVFGTETRDMMTKETCGILTSYVIVFYILMTLLARTSMRTCLPSSFSFPSSSHN
mmetsp:Transcript_39678/g.101981  ORF Transcript_39678/g.101981 Transcript_39678/m.101981 type:complete len:261 (-) Transcript_39678:367-1149(-)